MQANGVPLTLLQQPVLAVRGCLEGRESFPMWTRVCAGSPMCCNCQEEKGMKGTKCCLLGGAESLGMGEKYYAGKHDTNAALSLRRAQRQGKAALGCGCSAPCRPPTYLPRGCPAHTEFPKAFSLLNANQCCHLSSFPFLRNRL